MSALEKRVREILSRAANVPEEQLELDAELTSLGIGSLEQIEIVFVLEDELKIEFPTADLRQLRTIGDLVAVVRQASLDAAPR